MSLVAFVSQQKWTELEDAWTELMLQEGAPVDDVIETLRRAGDRKQLPRCVPLVKEHSELLRANSRSADAARMLGVALLLGGNPGELGPALYEAAVEAYGEEPWFESYCELSGLRANAQDMRVAWRAFDKCLNLRAGAVVFHAKGWGIGEVTDFDGDEARITFKSGKRDRFPLSSAIDIFEILPDDDLRSLVVKNPDELARLVKEEPLEVLRNVLVRFRGRAAYPVIKGALSQLGVDGSSFNGWWRKARKHAESSEWFEINGTSTKAQVTLLAEASDPAASMERSLRMAGSLGKALTRARDLVAGGSIDDTVRLAALATLEELASDDVAPLTERLSAWTFLRDQRGESPEPLRKRLVAAAYLEAPADPSQAPTLWQLFQELPTSRDQERACGMLSEVYPDAEKREAEILRHLQHAAPGMVRTLVAELLEKGRHAELAEHYIALLGRPLRNPGLLISLAELAENGKLEGDWPPATHRLQSFIRLGVHLEANRIGDPATLRAHGRLSSVLTSGSPSILRRLLEGADTAFLRSTLNMVGRGIDPPIENELVAVVAEVAPELFRDDGKPFWDSGLWTSRVGLERRNAELKELVEVQLPANSEAIGKAASYGDLSENSEWEAAIEEQRNLTARAQEIEAEVRSAMLLEEVSLPENTVAPGTSVRFREVESGRERAFSILGPWDADGEEIVSYRAPLAAGMLGLRPGQKGRLDLPSGALEVEIVAVEPFDFSRLESTAS